MYQFTTTNIINSSLDSNGTTAKYVGNAAYFQVARVGKFLKDNIVSVTKRPYFAGVLETATITIVNTGVTAGDVIRLEVDVRLSMQTDSEYANTYLYFKKPVVVEVIATANATTDAAALKTQINALKDRFGFSYITATNSGAVITLTATNVNQHFHTIYQKREYWATNTIIQPEYVTIATGAVATKGKIGFGTDDWMQRKVMLQTLDNTRYFGLSKDERPILGGNYTEFVLRYSVTKNGTDGIVAGGTSITTHVFYVTSTLAAAFEAAIETVTSLVVSTIAGGGYINIQESDADLDGAVTKANNATGTFQATGAVGTYTWSEVSDTSNVITVTAGTGAYTIHATNTGTAVLLVTDSEGTTATLTVTVE